MKKSLLFTWSEDVYQIEHVVDVKLQFMFLCVMSCTNLTLSRTGASDSVKDNHKKESERTGNDVSPFHESRKPVRQVLLQAVMRNRAAGRSKSSIIPHSTCTLIVVTEISDKIHRLRLKHNTISKPVSDSVFRCIGESAERHLVSTISH